jgi:hypothetical protein
VPVSLWLFVILLACALLPVLLGTVYSLRFARRAPSAMVR